MSVVSDKFLAGGERLLLATGHQDTLTVISVGSPRAGKKIKGRLDLEAVLDPDAPLGADPRMRGVFSVLPENQLKAGLLEYGDILTNGKTKWKVVKREDNDISITAAYPLEQLLSE